MAKRDYFLLVDTETTQDNLVADFGAIICDRKGKIYTQCAVLVNGIFTDMEKHPLFFTSDKSGIWSKKGQDRRYASYNRMVESGTRMLASVAAINIWLVKAAEKYNPYLTAYNISFDQNKCANTGIDLAQFGHNFCLWHAAANKWALTKAYRKFAIECHAFNNITKNGNMTYKANAETMARFILGNPRLADEPHTAIEDILYYELPILTRLVNTTKKEKWLNPKPIGWQAMQVKDWFIAK